MKTSFLDQIVARRRAHLATSDRTAREMPRRDPAHRFQEALRARDGAAIIAEFKRASPSLGEIRAGANAAQVIALYEAGGATAISVLTEPDFFKGSLDDLHLARATTSLPILRKDFIIDEIQITEAAAAGADAILLIVAALTDAELSGFRALAEEKLGLDALVEVHDAQEMERAIESGAKLIGVNNRNLRTFVTSLETSIELAALAPPGATLVSESGISSRADIERLQKCGYRGFLIGESLMRAADPVALLESLRHA
ncbi:MAG: indole-3-glycerol phosphate synthase TrpC [Chthoniobacterales bacterium]